MPFPLDILPCFWKSLLNLPLNLDEDLKEADILTYKFLKGLEEVTFSIKFLEMTPTSFRLKVRLNLLIWVRRRRITATS